MSLPNCVPYDQYIESHDRAERAKRSRRDRLAIEMGTLEMKLSLAEQDKMDRIRNEWENEQVQAIVEEREERKRKTGVTMTERRILEKSPGYYDRMAERYGNGVVNLGEAEER